MGTGVSTRVLGLHRDKAVGGLRGQDHLLFVGGAAVGAWVYFVGDSCPGQCSSDPVP